MRNPACNAATRSINIPHHLVGRPVSKKGYLVPWFVQQVGENEWDFRAMDPMKLHAAVVKNLCWLCGQPMGKFKTFVSGPMCGVNRTSAEPPSHKSCARYACQACPFLTQPKMVRNEKNLPEEASEPGGISIKRNPGVTMLWTTLTMGVRSTKTGPIFTMGDPLHVEWWAEGRRATLLEVQASVESGIPLLAQECESNAEVDALLSAVGRFLPLLPKAEMEMAS